MKNTEILMILYCKCQCYYVSVSSRYVATGDNLVLLTKYFQSVKIKENGVFGAGGMYGDEKFG
jgi:hypothetical protein